jgi:Polysaccharide lyase
VNWASCGREFVVAVSALLAFGGCASAVSAGKHEPGPIFVGDYETGNFDQWPWCQNVAVRSVPCSSFRTSTHSMQVQTNVVRPGRKFAARFEVRHGDQPKGICCGDRAEVSGNERAQANEGDDLWYQWSTLFDENFPVGPEWSVVSQWHASRVPTGGGYQRVTSLVASRVPPHPWRPGIRCGRRCRWAASPVGSSLLCSSTWSSRGPVC